MNRKEKQRLGRVKMYEQTQDAGLDCRKCGISKTYVMQMVETVSSGFGTN